MEKGSSFGFCLFTVVILVLPLAHRLFQSADAPALVTDLLPLVTDLLHQVAAQCLQLLDFISELVTCTAFVPVFVWILWGTGASRRTGRQARVSVPPSVSAFAAPT